MNSPFPSIFWIALSILTVVPLLVWRGRLSARQERIAYLGRWLLIPYLGLVTGALSPRLMGLTGIDWVAGFRNGVGLVVVIVLLLWLVRTLVAHPAAMVAGAPQRTESAAPLLHPAGWVQIMRTVLVVGGEQLHWCFLRAATQEAALLLTSGEPSSTYAAIWIATLLSAPEALLRVNAPPQRLIQIVALVATTVLFLFTGNFWLCWMLHAAIVVM